MKTSVVINLPPPAPTPPVTFTLTAELTSDEARALRAFVGGGSSHVQPVVEKGFRKIIEGSLTPDVDPTFLHQTLRELLKSVYYAYDEANGNAL